MFAFGIYSRGCPLFRNGDVDGSAAEVGKFVAASVVVKLRLGLVDADAAAVAAETGKWNNFAEVVVVAAAGGNFAAY